MERNGMTKAKQLVHLWPVEGRTLPGIPATETDADAETAAALIATGAFTEQPPAPEPVTED